MFLFFERERNCWLVWLVDGIVLEEEINFKLELLLELFEWVKMFFSFFFWEKEIVDLLLLIFLL